MRFRVVCGPGGHGAYETGSRFTAVRDSLQMSQRRERVARKHPRPTALIPRRVAPRRVAAVWLRAGLALGDDWRPADGRFVPACPRARGPVTRFNRAQALLGVNNVPAAVGELQEALTTRADWPAALGLLAWIRAPSRSDRSGCDAPIASLSRLRVVDDVESEVTENDRVAFGPGAP